MTVHWLKPGCFEARGGRHRPPLTRRGDKPQRRPAGPLQPSGAGGKASFSSPRKAFSRLPHVHHLDGSGWSISISVALGTSATFMAARKLEESSPRKVPSAMILRPAGQSPSDLGERALHIGQQHRQPDSLLARAEQLQEQLEQVSFGNDADQLSVAYDRQAADLAIGHDSRGVFHGVSSATVTMSFVITSATVSFDSR